MKKTPSQILAEGTLIDRAVNRAVRHAVTMHRRAGNPIAVWRGGRVVWVKSRSQRRRTAKG